MMKIIKEIRDQTNHDDPKKLETVKLYNQDPLNVIAIDTFFRSMHLFPVWGVGFRACLCLPRVHLPKEFGIFHKLQLLRVPLVQKSSTTAK